MFKSLRLFQDLFISTVLRKMAQNVEIFPKLFKTRNFIIFSPL